MKKYVLDQLYTDGLIYFLCNFNVCIAHCKNQKRLADERNDPIHQAAIVRYVDALYESGDIR